MKTLLFISALAFNIALCCYPFAEHSQPSATAEKVTPVPQDVRSVPRSEGLAYSDMLKNKASRLHKR